MKAERFPILVKEGGVTARIRQTTQVKNGTEYTSYLVEYTLLGKRQRESRSSLAEAKNTAAEACRKIAHGDHCALELKNRDRLVYLRAIEALEPIGIPLDVAVSEFATAIAILEGKGSLLEAAREYASRHSRELTHIRVSAAVERLAAQAKADGKSAGRQSRIASLLGRFARSFNVDVDSLTPKLVGDYLTTLPVKERTKANHRDMLGYFFRWCVTQGFLAKGTDLLEGVQTYSKRKYGAVDILTAEEMATLLTHARSELIPFLTLCGFAGLRSIEVQRLDWKDIDFEDGYIEVREEAAKQHEGEILRRIVPMSPNLKAWLFRVSKNSGRVCPFKKVENELDTLCAKAGVKWKHNCLRHSAISYRIAMTGDVPRIADESGNSPYVIRKNYLNRRKPWQAVQWFGISPGEASGQVKVPTPEEAKAAVVSIHLPPTLLKAAAA